MKQALLGLLGCPACRGPLSLTAQEERHGEIWQGELACQPCNHRYPIRQGMPHLFLETAAWAPKAQEAQGWVTIHQDLGIYEQVEDAVDLKIPYYPEAPWIGVARSFDMALDFLQLTGRETILDLGAGRGWAAKEFALRGCRVVALDVVPDENVGLGRGHAIMRHHNTYFDRVIGDGENLPFRPGSFDLVFCAATLHHTSHLNVMIGNIDEVLAPAGRLCAMNEPCISILEDEQTVLARDAAHELSVGINERRPNIVGYYQALQTHGFQIIQAIPAHAYQMEEQTLREWAYDLGALRGSLRWQQLPRSFWRYYNYGKNRLRAARRGVLDHSEIPAIEPERQRLAYAVLLWTTGELFLLAQKA